MTADPLGMIDGPNVYCYLNNNPINLLDPWGLCAGISGDSIIVEIYWRKLERDDWVGDVVGSVHPFMKDTSRGKFYELQAIKSGDKMIIKILEGDISKMSSGTQKYWNTNPKPDQVVNVSQSKFYQAIASYKTQYEGKNYSINLITHEYDCQGFKNYVITHSKI
jgi:hypothetical protein